MTFNHFLLIIRKVIGAWQIGFTTLSANIFRMKTEWKASLSFINRIALCIFYVDIGKIDSNKLQFFHKFKKKIIYPNVINLSRNDIRFNLLCLDLYEILRDSRSLHIFSLEVLVGQITPNISAKYFTKVRSIIIISQQTKIRRNAFII